MKTFYLTTPIYYPNARPHVGSAYTTIVCDVIARYKRMCGYDVAFLTGTDEHGEKLQRAAEAAGKSPSEFVASKRRLFRELWRFLNISDYRFVHTSQNPDHVRSVQWMLRQADKNGYIEKKKYEGRYCVDDERYISDSAEPANCDICGRPAELITEENYFFKLSAFQEWLLAHYEAHPEFVQPYFRRNEVKSFVKGGLRDISVSRKRIKWGIPWPHDREQVFYVWYDALTSYMTGIGFGSEDATRKAEFQKYWPADLHMIGKDILRFHAVYWPAFLMAAFPNQPEMLPKTVFAHGWIYYEQDKMSKSKGNVVYPEPIVEAIDSFGAPGNDTLRYYLLRDTPFALDGSFSYEGLIDRYNFDLANDLGNLVNRTVNMLHQYCDGRIPEPMIDWKTMLARSQAATETELIEAEALEAAVAPEVWKFIHDSRTRELAEKAQILKASFVARFKGYEFEYALANTWGENDQAEPLGLIAATNKYLTDNAPWKLAQQGVEVNRQKMDTILNTSAEAVRFVTVLLSPFIPRSAERIWAQLGCKDYVGDLENQRIDQLQWGGLKHYAKVGKPEPIFPRLDKAKTLAKLHELAEADYVRDKPKEALKSMETESAKAPKPRTPSPESRPSSPSSDQKISIDDFAKVDMRVGEVKSAERVSGAQKLVKLMVDIGSEVRQVVAGIAEYYQPEQLVGMKVVLVTNLQPRKLRGVESNGMVLAATVGEEGKPVLVTVREDAPNGSRLK